ncbi:MAG: FAD-dependent oxidoreductase [Atopobiaceae bacterium]|jgi:NADPH-dependent 2,4-dienoyl-CoA reductase/sulfur reductase-like enzyme|nr:FAD-dependent oxidoreductase [Atopobiaceae bacterium]MCH4119574.1 FAD-dependent oxidoreductase [Atopobiaceae bacterium]MCI1389541.1 FAD-dependent oxidoreductase [Atopobiaceae bacterium]MCI1431605.1 FAD-dependent oxidoreductase [Atopobiaceae bacterium]MCI1470041.1 FAD-dependent oxidoreductase [Atopobiaceae bacterium]
MGVRNLSCDVLVVGGGAAGLSAANAAAYKGAKVLIVEREGELGGILNQCIHNGFGLHRFGEELTGPEFANKDEVKVEANPSIEVELGCSVLELAHDGNHLRATVSSEALGLAHVSCGAIVLACGCRERTRGQINIAGGRPAGVYTAGSAQKLINVDGALVGKRVVILGSGDIGLIMARRMTWEGAKVLMVCELASEPGGLRRNIQQCLVDNDIPLYLSRTVTQVFGHDRLEAVELADVDPATMRPIPGTEQRVECDTLLLSVGLIPENELAKTIGIRIDRATSGPAVDESLETSVPGIFVAGNELHVHDLADYVSEEGEVAGRNAAEFALGERKAGTADIEVVKGENVGGMTPQHVTGSAEGVTIRFRPRKRIQGAEIRVTSAGELVKRARRMIVVPSEMQTIELSADDMAKVTGPIEVSCTPVANGKKGA